MTLIIKNYVIGQKLYQRVLLLFSKFQKYQQRSFGSFFVSRTASGENG